HRGGHGRSSARTIYCSRPHRPRARPAFTTWFGDAENQAADAADSFTHASLANHWCSLRQCGQNVWAKKTGEHSKRGRSTSIPVETSRPVAGQRIITIPIVPP